MLALIAGTGELPTRVAARLRKWPMVCALDGFAPDELIPEVTFKIETLGSFLRTLAEKGVHEVCFAGAIRRPKVDAAAIDMATAPLVPRIVAAMGQGDDAALRAVIGIFEDAGFKVRGVDELVADFLMKPGVPTLAQPSEQDKADAERALSVLATLSPLDVGQACVAASGQVLAIETLGGTDFMLDGMMGDDGTRHPRLATEGGVLVKLPKQGQDRRIDLPTIGVPTVDRAAKAGLKGIVIEAGGVMVVNMDQVVTAANRHGLFLWACEANS
ncbi:MAG: LpxI family protein [Planktomarina sp.]